MDINGGIIKIGNIIKEIIITQKRPGRNSPVNRQGNITDSKRIRRNAIYITAKIGQIVLNGRSAYSHATTEHGSQKQRKNILFILKKRSLLEKEQIVNYS